MPGLIPDEEYIRYLVGYSVQKVCVIASGLDLFKTVRHRSAQVGTLLSHNNKAGWLHAREREKIED